VSYSRIAIEALMAAELLATQGVSAEVIDLRTISPWDRETVIASVRKTGRLLIAHEAVKAFGVGAEVAAEVGKELFSHLKKPIERLGGAYAPVPFSAPLEAAYAPDRKRIAQAALVLVRD
jgi:pyruvate dehydrogenase E1 component beta subunit